MSGLLPAEVEDYLYRMLPERDAVFRDMEVYAAERKVPIVGPAVGRLLSDRRCFSACSFESTL